MKRREFVAGVLAVPACAALSKVLPSRAIPPADGTTTLQIVLDGQFAIVIRQSDKDHISAFVPLEPNDLHALVVNRFAEDDTRHTHAFKFVDNGALQLGNPQPVPSSSTDDCLSAFSYTSSENSHNDLFAITFPNPSALICDSGGSTQVTLANGQSHSMPQGHILEYTVRDPTKQIKVTDTKTGKDFAAQRSGSNLVISIDIGMYLFGNTNPGSVASQAQGFYNNQLLPIFPGIDPKKYALSDVPTTRLRPHKLKNKVQSIQKGRPVILSSIVECQVGGLVVTVPNG